jgi:hypothetical protein
LSAFRHLILDKLSLLPFLDVNYLLIYGEGVLDGGLGGEGGGGGRVRAIRRRELREERVVRGGVQVEGDCFDDLLGRLV